MQMNANDRRRLLLEAIEARLRRMHLVQSNASQPRMIKRPNIVNDNQNARTAKRPKTVQTSYIPPELVARYASTNRVAVASRAAQAAEMRLKNARSQR